MSRAHPLRALPANRALLARPGASPVPARAEPAPSRSQDSATELTPPLTLHKFHALRCGSALSPESAPATFGACARCSPHSAAIQPPWVPCSAERPGYLPLRTDASGRSPPAARSLRPGLGVARPDSAPPAAWRAPGPASPRRRPRALLPRSPRAPARARSRPARSELRLLPAPVSAVTALGNMATEGMILTNHDHQIRVGVLTGNRGRRPAAAAAGAPDLPLASCLW